MNLWWRVAILGVAAALMIWLRPSPMSAAVTLAVLACCLWLGGVATHASPGRNTGDAGRASPRVLVAFAAAAIGFFGAAIAWIAMMTRVAPDNYAGAAAIFVPALGAVVAGVICLTRVIGSLFGGRRP